jgi:hypothetical protein
MNALILLAIASVINASPMPSPLIQCRVPVGIHLRETPLVLNCGLNETKLNVEHTLTVHVPSALANFTRVTKKNLTNIEIMLSMPIHLKYTEPIVCRVDKKRQNYCIFEIEFLEVKMDTQVDLTNMTRRNSPVERQIFTPIRIGFIVVFSLHLVMIGVIIYFFATYYDYMGNVFVRDNYIYMYCIAADYNNETI